MVALKHVQASNSLIKSTWPSGLVAVFAGATSGIGAYSLKEFAHLASKPRIYFIGRSQESADRLLVELRSLNPGGEYLFLQCDASLMRNIDEVCLEIKRKESAINVLFMSQGTLKFGSTTSEGLPYISAVTYYGRVRFLTNLLPLLRAAPGLRRVVSVLAATYEGPVFPDDWPAARSVAPSKWRGHTTSMVTLAHAEAARRLAPDVSFVHDYPGAVKTGLLRGDEGLALRLAAHIVFPVMTWLRLLHPVPERECGERHVYYCTSAMYPAAAAAAAAAAADRVGAEGSDGVPLAEGSGVAPGVDGKTGSGVYSLFWDGEGGKPGTEKYIREHTAAGLGANLWEHTMGEFERITRAKAI